MIKAVLLFALVLCVMSDDVKFSKCLPKKKTLKYDIKSIDIIPIKPHAGDTLIATVVGNVLQSVTKGNIHLDIAYQGQTLLQYDFDLCENISCGCPTQLGDATVTISHLIPPIILPGWYNFTCTASDEKEEDMMCVKFDIELVKKK